jgi:hypothetical protein
VVPVGVVGEGGSGKSRLCGEFCIGRRLEGAAVVAAKHANTPDDPYAVVADLLANLVPDEIRMLQPVNGVFEALCRYNKELAETVKGSLVAILGAGDRSRTAVDHQDLISALVVLILARGREAPLIVHFQDMHWASAEILLLLDRLLWQVDLEIKRARGRSGRGVLVIFEGRFNEMFGKGPGGWTSEAFESFLRRLRATLVRCPPFSSPHRLEFVESLFEAGHAAHRLVHSDLIELQQVLIDDINRRSGGNPFHTTTTLQHLLDMHVLGQNPKTGFLYMIRPLPTGLVLPDEVFDSIQLRWEYLKEKEHNLAILHRGVALVDDRIPEDLFVRLWTSVAPDSSRSDIDRVGILSVDEGHEVAFRHENYFHSLRRFQLEPSDLERVVSVFDEWYGSIENPSPVDRFKWARALLATPERDLKRAKALLRDALARARRADDGLLVRRIATALLDHGWKDDAKRSLPNAAFLRLCDDELDLGRTLLGSDRAEARLRLDELTKRVGRRLSAGGRTSDQTIKALQRRQLTAEVLIACVMFNDGEQHAASRVAAQAVTGVRALRPQEGGGEAWRMLEQEALYAEMVALALSGKNDEALRAAREAWDLAGDKPTRLLILVISTYANIIRSRDSEASERLLRDCLRQIDEAPALATARDHVEINLSLTLLLRYQSGGAEARASASLGEVRRTLTDIANASFRLGRYPTAGAAALMRGIVSALCGEGDEVQWFGQAVAATDRGTQTETRWRAHINLAMSLYLHEGAVTPSVRDHADAALRIMERTFPPSQPEESPRFRLLRLPLAHAASFLIRAGDEEGRAVLRRYPSLRSCFEDPAEGILREDRGGYEHHEWVRVGEVDYVVY